MKENSYTFPALHTSDVDVRKILSSVDGSVDIVTIDAGDNYACLAVRESFLRSFKVEYGIVLDNQVLTANWGWSGVLLHDESNDTSSRHYNFRCYGSPATNYGWRFKQLEMPKSLPENIRNVYAAANKAKIVRVTTYTNS